MQKFLKEFFEDFLKKILGGSSDGFFFLFVFIREFNQSLFFTHLMETLEEWFKGVRSSEGIHRVMPDFMFEIFLERTFKESLMEYRNNSLKKIYSDFRLNLWK